MYSLSWPNMFTSVDTKLLKDKEAIKSNLILLFNSEFLELFGDPYYGTPFKAVQFQPNEIIISDFLIDAIYTAIETYFPQLYVPKNNIEISRDHTKLYATIRVTYRLDNTSDLYYIALTDNQQEG